MLFSTIHDTRSVIHDTPGFDCFWSDSITVSKAKPKRKERKTVMENVKGCEFFNLTKYTLNRIVNGKIGIEESLQSVLSYEVLSNMLTEAKTDFVDGSGKTIKGMPSEEIFVMTKKIEKKKYIIGLSSIKRIAGEPSGKKGIERWFEESRDKFVESKRFFADGFEKEKAYFDFAMVDHLRNSIGSGQAGSAEYQDKIVTRVKSKKILGINITRTALFILMIIVWGMAFKNIALGICFAVCFLGSFTLVTNKSMSEQSDLAKAET